MTHVAWKGFLQKSALTAKYAVLPDLLLRIDDLSDFGDPYE